MTEAKSTALKFGPVWLEEGVGKGNAWSLMYAALITIGIVTGMAAMTPYVLTANLGIAESEQGKALGTLALWQELALLAAYGPIGALSDKIGRRAVYAAGLLALAMGYLLYPYAGSMAELSVYRVIYALGIGAATGMLATVIADYGQEQDRGKLTALCGFLNGLGVVVVTLFIGKLPALFSAGGATDIEAGRMTMALAGGLCAVSAVILWLGLKPGTPVTAAKRKSTATLLREGMAAARANPRIALAYGSAFVARGDLAIVGLFAIAWGKQAAIEDGLSASDALSAGIIPFVIAQSTALLWPGVIAVPLDRFNRVLALAGCMALGAIGYCLLILVDDPLSGAAIPFFVLLGIGQISAFLGAQTLISKEAPIANRGSVIGAFNFCGAMGILVLSLIGGWLFDEVGPWAPFMLVGILNGAVALACMARFRAEGRLA